MVSIPDWSRFRRGPPPPSSPIPHHQLMTQRERYMQAMEKEAISEAKRKGYFLEATREGIIHRFGDTGGAEDPLTGLPMAKQTWHVQFIRYSQEHMKALGDIPLFSRITILTIDNNYISSIDALDSCRELLKLDIHSNQIVTLPDSRFWANKPKLKILIAHDNPIARVEIIHSLTACGRLQILTLYDTPLSLKKNYRHHIVNTIWSLKALDSHVISDEEIIEDAVFSSSRFAALGNPFEIDLCPPVPKVGARLEEELQAVYDIISKVDKIMAHFCPVIMIQKTIRMWLTYKRYKLYMESRLWAAITIQRAWRDYKDLPDPIILDSFLETKNKQRAGAHAFRDSQGQHEAKRVASQLKVPPSGSSLATPSPLGSGRRSRGMHRKNLVIDLKKLEELSASIADPSSTINILTQAHKMSLKRSPVRRQVKQKHPQSTRKKRRVMTVRHFFGPIMKSSEDAPNPHRSCNPAGQSAKEFATSISAAYQEIPAIEELDEVPKTAFRLKGTLKKIVGRDAYEEVMLSRREVGQDIRDMETALHDRKSGMPQPQRIKRDVNVKDKFLYQRMQQTMALSCLNAVQQAYRDRELDEKKALIEQRTMSFREYRESVKERVKIFHEERKLAALKVHEEEFKLIKDVLLAQETKQGDNINKIMITKERRKKQKALRKAEVRFASEFRTQHNSVSKALIRHDQQLHRDTFFQKKIEKVTDLRDVEREQHEIVKKYLQHRKMVRQAENSMARASLDTKMLQEANDRLYEARSRVEQLKSRTQNVQQYVSVPATAMHAPEGPAVEDLSEDITSCIDDITSKRLTAGRIGIPSTQLQTIRLV